MVKLNISTITIFVLLLSNIYISQSRKLGGDRSQGKTKRQNVYKWWNAVKEKKNPVASSKTYHKCKLLKHKVWYNDDDMDFEDEEDYQEKQKSFSEEKWLSKWEKFCEKHNKPNPDTNPEPEQSKYPTLVDISQSGGCHDNTFVEALVDMCKSNLIEITYDTTFAEDNSDALKVVQDGLDELKKLGGGTLYVPEGLYIIDGQVNMHENTCLKGDGMDKTILKLQNNAKPYTYKFLQANSRPLGCPECEKEIFAKSYETNYEDVRQNLINEGVSFREGLFKKSGFVRTAPIVSNSDESIDNIVVQGMTLDGNRKNQEEKTADDHYGKYGFFSEKSTNIFLNELKIVNFQGYGFDPHGTKSEWGHGLVITNSVAESNGYDGFTLDQTIGITITGSESRYNDRHGINVVTASKKTCVSHNLAEYNGYATKGCGIAVQSNQKELISEKSGKTIEESKTQNYKLEGNVILDNIRGGICLKDAPDATLKDNYIRGFSYCMKIKFMDLETMKTESNYCNTISPIQDEQDLCDSKRDLEFETDTYTKPVCTCESSIDYTQSW